MARKSDLQYLVNLIDDETIEVREEVLKQLSNYGTHLEEDLLEFADLLDRDMLQVIQPLLDENRKKWLLANWDKWYDIDDEYKKLEFACVLIVRFQSGISSPSRLGILLDQLADEFKNKIPYGNEIDLANFLFSEKGITGNPKDYHNPMNSNLDFVITNGKGLPISLSILYMLVGNRVGFDISGCNFPGHFLSRIFIEGELILVDGFHGGRLLYESDLTERFDIQTLETVEPLIRERAAVSSIIKRVLNNLVTSYKRKDENGTANFFTGILKTTPWNIEI